MFVRIFLASLLVACKSTSGSNPVHGPSQSLSTVYDLSRIVSSSDDISGMRFDSNGNLFVNDRGGHRVLRVVNTTGATEVFAGSGIKGDADGVGATASLSYPLGMLIDANDNLYIGEETHHPNYLVRVRKISPAGQVTTVATLPGSSNDLGSISGLAFDENGGIVVSRYYSLWKVSLAGAVSHFSGTGTQNYLDGSAGVAGYYTIGGLTGDGHGNFYVGDFDGVRFYIRKIDSSGNVVTIVNDVQVETLEFSGGKLFGCGYPVQPSSGDLFVVDLSGPTVSTLLSNAVRTDGHACNSMTLGPDYSLYFDSANSVIRTTQSYLQ